MTYEQLAADIRGRSRHRGQGSLIVAVDGMSGSGKTGFARRLAHELRSPLISSDDLVPGWEGLEASIDLLVEWVLRPVASGQPARWRRYDWAADRPGEWAVTPVSDVLVVEGCCVGAPPAAPYLSYLVWVETPEPQRRARLKHRGNWPEYEPFFDKWTTQEERLQTEAKARERADLIVDNSGTGAQAGWGRSFAPLSRDAAR